MFDLVNNNRQFVVIAFGAVSLGLLLGTGLTGYDSFTEEPYIAKVGERRVTEREFVELTGGQTIPENMRPQVMEQLVKRSLLLNEAEGQNIGTSDKQLQDTILAIEAFKDNGKFDPVRYKSMLAAQRMTVKSFEDRMRDDLRVDALVSGFQDASFSSKLATERLAALMAEPREVSLATFTTAQYLDKVNVNDAEVKKYYDAHVNDFRVPERAKLEYVVLSQEELAAKVSIDAEKIAKYFEEHKSEYTNEKRHARHILISADEKASAEQKTAAKQKAEKLLAQVKKEPSKFPDLAKTESQDPGSAAQGGDLGFFNRGMMVKPFDDAVFSLKAGEISGVIETSFGYHIIQLIDVKVAGLEDSKAAIESLLRKQEAQRLYEKDVAKLGDLAFQKPDSLKPLVDEFKLEVKQSDWITREAAADPLLNDTKVRDAAFSDDVLKKKHNTEAIEVKAGVQLVARVASYEASRTRTIDEAKAEISTKLKQQAAFELAKKEGAAALAALQKGESATVTWSPPAPMTRNRTIGLPEKAVEAVFGAKLGESHSYVGYEDEARHNYVLFKVAKASAATPVKENSAVVLETVKRGFANQQLDAYVKNLRERYPVTFK